MLAVKPDVKPSRVVVFGSVNMDLVARVERFPRPGETITGDHFFTAPGGKGANQAVAAARLGAQTRMVGRVGADTFGETLLDGLASQGVDIAGVIRDENSSSGVAMIEVTASGENTIIVVPGANGRLERDDLDRLEVALDGARVLLLQLEVPMSMVVEAARLARERGVLVILDPAPAQVFPDGLLELVDLITPNESEAAALVGFAINEPSEVARASKLLLERGARGVLIKRGEHGVYWTDGRAEAFRPTFPVRALDTVAAGDAFNGGLAAALAEGLEIGEALDWGLATSAISVTRSGAQPSLPDREEVIRLLADRSSPIQLGIDSSLAATPAGMQTATQGETL